MQLQTNTRLPPAALSSGVDLQSHSGEILFISCPNMNGTTEQFTNGHAPEPEHGDITAAAAPVASPPTEAEVHEIIQSIRHASAPTSPPTAASPTSRGQPDELEFDEGAYWDLSSMAPLNASSKVSILKELSHYTHIHTYMHTTPSSTFIYHPNIIDFHPSPLSLLARCFPQNNPTPLLNDEQDDSDKNQGRNSTTARLQAPAIPTLGQATRQQEGGRPDPAVCGPEGRPEGGAYHARGEFEKFLWFVIAMPWRQEKSTLFLWLIGNPLRIGHAAFPGGKADSLEETPCKHHLSPSL